MFGCRKFRFGANLAKNMALVMAVCACLYVLYMIDVHYSYLPVLHDEKKNALKLDKDNPPMILFWNGIGAGSVNGVGSQSVVWLLAQNVSACPFQCRYSHDRNLVDNASLLLFHVRDPLTPLPPNRLTEQLYMFFLLESAANSGDYYKQVPRDFFNISMTYRLDSDIQYPYDTFDELSAVDSGDDAAAEVEKWTDDEVQKKLDGKSSLALQFVSNCHPQSGRDKYVEELHKHMNVTVMGACVNRKGCSDECAEKLYDSHFFYLAFEYSVCHHYVTEKFWILKKLIVPVVLTRRVFEGLSYVPEDVFISADDFDSAEQLANHLKMVAADKQLYMKHLKWTRRFKKSPHAEEVMNPRCRLCQFVHEQLEQPKQRRIEDIVKFWEVDGNCQDNFVANHLLKKKGK